MSATPDRTIPTTWDDSRDGALFRITAGLFSGDFCLAGVLLATYDVDDATTHSDSRRRPVCAARPRPVSSGPAGQAVNEKKTV
jgi:hypothetical protein